MTRLKNQTENCLLVLQASVETAAYSNDFTSQIRAPITKLIQIGIELLSGTHGVQFTSLVLINKIVDVSITSSREQQGKSVIDQLSERIHAGSLLSLVLNSITLQRRVVGNLFSFFHSFVSLLLYLNK